MPTAKDLLVKAIPIGNLQPWIDNPRFIRRDRLESLKKSIERDPDLMWRRPVLALNDGTVYAGNQRLQACIELGWNAIPAVLDDVAPEIMRARAVRDNNSWGEWNDAQLLTVLSDLADVETPRSLGFGDAEIASILRQATPSLAPMQPSDRSAEDGIVPDHRITDAPRWKGSAAGKDAFEGRAIRQIVLYFPLSQYDEIVSLLEEARRALAVDSNTEAIETLLRRFHADHHASTKSD